jgi:hypothetical protein
MPVNTTHHGAAVTHQGIANAFFTAPQRITHFPFFKLSGLPGITGKIDAQHGQGRPGHRVPPVNASFLAFFQRSNSSNDTSLISGIRRSGLRRCSLRVKPSTATSPRRSSARRVTKAVVRTRCRAKLSRTVTETADKDFRTSAITQESKQTSEREQPIRNLYGDRRRS